MSALLEHFQQSSAARQAKTLATYRELVTRADAPRKGDGEALAACLGEMGLSTADVEHDAAAAQQAAQLRARILTDEQADEVKRLDRETRDQVARASSAEAMGLLRDAMRDFQERGDAISLENCALVANQLFQLLDGHYAAPEHKRDDRKAAFSAAFQRFREAEAPKSTGAEPAPVVESRAASAELSKLMAENPRIFE